MSAAGLVALAVGCGGSDAAADPLPTDAVVADFCEAYVGDTQQIFADVDVADPDYEAIADGFGEWADELEAVGTPPDASEEVRAGLEEAVAAMRDLTAADIEEYWTSRDENAAPFDFTDAIVVFDSYAGETCVDGGSETE